MTRQELEKKIAQLNAQRRQLLLTFDDRRSILLNLQKITFALRAREIYRRKISGETFVCIAHSLGMSSCRVQQIYWKLVRRKQRQDAMNPFILTRHQSLAKVLTKDKPSDIYV